jgi:hypothetical protein
MKTKTPSKLRPSPRTAFGHPVVNSVKPKHEVCNYKAGHDESSPPAEAMSDVEKGPAKAILPPRNAVNAPKISLAERIRQRLSEKEALR